MHPDPKDRMRAASALSDKWVQSLVALSFEPARKSQLEPQFSPSVADLTEDFASWNTLYLSEDKVAVMNGNPPETTRNLIDVTQKPVAVVEQTQTSSSLGTTASGVVQGQSRPGNSVLHKSGSSFILPILFFWTIGSKKPSLLFAGFA